MASFNEFYKGLSGIQDELNKMKLQIAAEEDYNENLGSILLDIENENQQLVGNVAGFAMEVQIAQAEAHSGALKKIRLDKEIEEIGDSIQQTRNAIEQKLEQKEIFQKRMFAQRDKFLELHRKNYEYYMRDSQVEKYETVNKAYLDLMEVRDKKQDQLTNLQKELKAYKEAALTNWSSFVELCVKTARVRHDLEPQQKELSRLTMQLNQLKTKQKVGLSTSLSPALSKLSFRKIQASQSPLARMDSASSVMAKLQALKQQVRPSTCTLKLPHQLPIPIPKPKTIPRQLPPLAHLAAVPRLKLVSRNEPTPAKLPRILTPTTTNTPAPPAPKMARVELEKPKTKAPAPLFEFKKPNTATPAPVQGRTLPLMLTKIANSVQPIPLGNLNRLSASVGSVGISQKKSQDEVSSGLSLTGTSSEVASKENTGSSASSILGFDCSSTRSLFGSPTSGTNLSDDGGFLGGFFSPSPGPQTGGSRDDIMANIFGFSPLGNSGSTSGSSGSLF